MAAAARAAAVAWAGVLAAVMSGCGQAPGSASPSPSPSSGVVGAADSARRLVPEAYDGRYRASATVLASPQHGPQLCFAVADSYPPQCEGPDIKDWDWEVVESETAAGTTWGSYELVGTFADGAFTLTEPATVPRAMSGPPDGADTDRFATPCPEPARGWKPTDPPRATDAALEETQSLASASPGYAALWLDQPLPRGEVASESANDLERSVLNVSTTGDADTLDASLRSVWGGALCVSTAPRSEADLLAVQAALSTMPGQVSSGLDPFDGAVDLAVVHGTLERQEGLDREFGVGAVRLSSLLEPID